MRAEHFLGRLTGECLSRNPRQRLEVGAQSEKVIGLALQAFTALWGRAVAAHAPGLGAVGNLLPSSTTTSPC